MSIKYNKFGEVVSVNGIVTGHHLGAPMQDAKPKRPEDNDVYATEMSVQTTIPNSDELLEEQPKPMGGGVSSWNDLTDKPFYGENLIIEWDGNPEGKDIIDMGNMPMYKVSDKVLTKNDFVGATIKVDNMEIVLTEEMVSELFMEFADGLVIGLEFPILSTSKTIFDPSSQTFASSAPSVIEFPSTGTYFGIPMVLSNEIVKTIDPKYLPQTGGGGMFVNVSKDSTGKYVADHTYVEVYNSIVSGQNTVVGLSLSTGDYILFPYYVFNGIKFTTVISGGQYEQPTITFNTDDTITFTQD